MILYGLCYSWLTHAALRQLDAFQARILRRTLRVKASMISHVTNDQIFKDANTTPLSSLLRSQQFRYFGHVLRSKESRDPIYAVCFDNMGNVRRLSSRRRIGHPSQKWTTELCARTCEHFQLPVSFNAHTITPLAGNRRQWQQLVRTHTRYTALYTVSR